MRYGYLIVCDNAAYDIVTVKTNRSISDNIGNYIWYKLPDATYYSGVALAGVELFESEVEAEEQVTRMELS